MVQYNNIVDIQEYLYKLAEKRTRRSSIIVFGEK